VQIAVAFCLINLLEFKIQTSLAVARDRVVGILLGLFMMWLAFDRLWSAPASVEMKRSLVSGLRLLAEFAREPVSKDIGVAIERSYVLRETINSQFDKVRSLADGVIFEFGASRQQNLALRDHIRKWQPQLRTLFVMRIASLKYRLRLPGFELPEAVEAAQKVFDEQIAAILDGMADRIEAEEPATDHDVENPLERLEQTIRTCCSEAPQTSLMELRTFLALSRNIESVTMSLDKEI
jgi:multidrug resistance protein MdtO